MKEQLKAVEKFHDAFGVKNEEFPSLVPENTFLLRYKLMAEENDEYKEACFNGDIVEIADALGDQLYILCGTILAHGLQDKIEEVFSEIQKSNMSKLGPDGKPIINDGTKDPSKPIGKVLKGPMYIEPDIASVLYKHETN